MIVQARVKTGAKEDSIRFDDREKFYHISVKARPVAGEANKAILKLVAFELGIPVSTICLKNGSKSKLKLFEY